MSRSILILGAGELGLAVLEALAGHSLSKGTKITVLLRQATLDSAAPEKQKTVQHLKALGMHFAVGDVVLDTQEELAALFSGYDVVVSCTGMGAPPGTQTKITEAALAGKVKRFFPWQFGMDYDAIGQGSSQDLFDEQLEVRAKLRSQDTTGWTIVSTGVFMSFLFRADFGIVDLTTQTARALGSWDTAITATTPRDIGRITADLILDPRDDARGGRVAFVAGDTVTYGQLAGMVDARFGRRFGRELWDAAALQRQLAEQQQQQPGSAALVKYRDTFARGVGVAWGKERTENEKRGMGMTDVRTYLDEMDVKLGEVGGEGS